MGILSLASGKSLDRGYHYFIYQKVLSFSQKDENCYCGTVSGSNHSEYEVEVNIAHPRKSHCNCPHAEGRRIICKHIVALYFTVFPEEAEEYIREMEALWQQAEEIHEYREERIMECIRNLDRMELEEALSSFLLSGPDWQMDEFLNIYDPDGFTDWDDAFGDDYDDDDDEEDYFCDTNDED